jgi:hypothetical protein
MNFTALDPAILAWSNRNRVPLSTKYQDAEVRSFELAGPSGRTQIWIEAVDGSITVHVWDYKKRKQSMPATADRLEAILDDALRMAQAWMT